MSAPKHCKGCGLFSAHKNKRGLTEGQKTHDDWCCGKGQKAIKAVAYCKIHNLKVTKTV
jgi:hypothetical protein